MKEKEQAHKEYREAISKGHGAYLMDEETPVSLSHYYVHRDRLDVLCAVCVSIVVAAIIVLLPLYRPV